MTHKLIKTDNYLLVVDDNKDIEENMWTVKDGKVREVSYLGQDNGYAIIAHLPLNSSPILEGVDLLPPYSRHQEDGIELLIPFPEYHCRDGREIKTWMDGWEEGHKEGYQVAREKYVYTEEDMRKAITMARELEDWWNIVWEYEYDDIIQSLHQYPTEFECETEYDCCKRYVNCIGCDATEDMINIRPKKITTAQGRQWVGKYK